jgi:hypothetical protein
LLVAATSNGKLFFINENILVGELQSPFSSLSALCLIPSGIVCAGNSNSLAVYERTSDGKRSEHYIEKIVLNLPEAVKGNIKVLTLGITKDKVLCTTDHNEFYLVSLASMNYVKVDFSMYSVRGSKLMYVYRKRFTYHRL